MIKLQKEKVPNILLKNELKWTNEYLNIISNKLTATKTQKERYKHKQIKDALLRETSGKCAYCESEVRSVTWEHIDHIIPKSIKPELYVKWDNLTFSCPKCNINKSDNYIKDIPLLNPYEVDFEAINYLRFAGPTIMPIIDNARSRLSYIAFDLNRIDLVEKRQNRIIEVDKLLQEWSSTIGVKKTVIEKELHDTYSSKQEFSATIKEYLRVNGFPIL